MALHPDPQKEGTRIDKSKYDIIKSTILEILKINSLTYKELSEKVKHKLQGKFDGSIQWYTVTVKLDLEAREVIKVDRSTSPQMISL